MDLKGIVKQFVLSHFDVTDDFFNVAWDFVNANLTTIDSSAASSPSRIKEEFPMQFIGETSEQAWKAIVIFAKGFKEIDVSQKNPDLIGLLQKTCTQMQADITLQNEILKSVTENQKHVLELLRTKHITEIMTAKETQPEKLILEPSIKPEQTEKYDYLFYSHVNNENPKDITKEEVTKLRNLSLKEKEEQFDIFLDIENCQLFAKGVPKKITEKDIPMNFLVLVLKNVGGSCTFMNIGKEVWNDDGTNSNLIHQTRHRVSKLTEGVIDLFVEHGTRGIIDMEKTPARGIKETIRDLDVYYIRKENFEGHKFKYCLIIPKD
ncbi:MAG: hypothetical protein V2A65_02945 [Candidatus Omnitrophota bacterium]